MLVIDVGEAEIDEFLAAFDVRDFLAALAPDLGHVGIQLLPPDVLALLLALQHGFGRLPGPYLGRLLAQVVLGLEEPDPRVIEYFDEGQPPLGVDLEQLADQVLVLRAASRPEPGLPGLDLPFHLLWRSALKM